MIGGLAALRHQKRKHPLPVQKEGRKKVLARMDAAIDRGERKIKDAFVSGVKDLQSVVSVDTIARVLETQGADGVVGLYDPTTTANAFQGLGAAIGDTAAEGGKIAATSQGPVIGVNGVKVNFVFNATNPRLSSFAQSVAATRIREISEDVRGVVRDTVRDGTVRGFNPRDTARRVRASIGLTRKQEQAVQNFRRGLETRDPAVLARQLRDRRFDPAVRRAIFSDVPLDPAKVDKMTNRYRERYVKFRSEVIARTESTRAINGASRELMESYVDEGLIDAGQIRRFWHHTRDARTREAHRQIDGMNPDGVGLNEPFNTPLGPLMYPGDPSGTAENTIQCRCTVFDRIVSAELLGTSAPEGVGPVPVQDENTLDAVVAGRPLHERGRVRSAFSSAPPVMMALLRKIKPTQDIYDVAGATSHFQIKWEGAGNFTPVGRITMNSGYSPTKYDEVFRHEYGHHIDAMAGTTLAPIKGAYESYRAATALRHDGDKMVKALTGNPERIRDYLPVSAEMTAQSEKVLQSTLTIFNRVNKRVEAGGSLKTTLRKEYADRGLDMDEMAQHFYPLRTGGAASNARFLAAWDEKDHAYLFSGDVMDWTKPTTEGLFGGVSDSIQASTGGRFGHRYGHDSSYYADYFKYYDQRGLANAKGGIAITPLNTTQAFANFVDVYSSRSAVGRAWYQHFLPETYDAFEKRVFELAK
jgi:hypothetical protein